MTILNLLCYIALSFLSSSIHSEELIDVSKYDIPCENGLPYYLSIYSDEKHYYLNIKITNFLNRNIWIPTEIGPLGVSKNLEFTIHIGKFYSPYIMTYEFTPKTEKIESGKNYSTTYKIERKYIDSLIKRAFKPTNKLILDIRLALEEFEERTLLWEEKEYDAYMRKTCIAKLSIDQKLPIPIDSN